MNNRILVEFLKTKTYRYSLNESDSEFSSQVPKNDYKGDFVIPGFKSHLNKIQKMESETELEKDVPDNKFSGDSTLPSAIIDPAGKPDDGTLQSPENRIAEPDFSDISPEEPAGEIPPEQIPQDIVPGDPTSSGMDPMAGGMPGMDPMAGGGMDMFGMPQPLDPSSIGKVYILKKIYSRLLSVHSNLSYLGNPKFDEIKEVVNESLDHFKNIIRNFDQFKDKLDDIIVLFQKFLVSTVNKVEELLEEESYSEEN